MNLPVILLIYAIVIAVSIFISNKPRSAHIKSLSITLAILIVLLLIFGAIKGGLLGGLVVGFVLAISGTATAIALTSPIARFGWIAVLAGGIIAAGLSILTADLIEGVGQYNLINMSDRMMNRLLYGPTDSVSNIFLLTPVALLSIYKILAARMQPRSSAS